MNRTTFLTIILILLFFAFIGCEEKETDVPPPELKDKIVYVSEDGICTINPDGTDRKVMVPSDKGAPFSNPQWSPDNRKIAFNGMVEGRNRIMVVDPGGYDLQIFGLPESKKKKLKPGEKQLAWGYRDLYFCGWSPSSKNLLYYFPIIDGGRIGLLSINGELIINLPGFGPCFAGEDSVVYMRSYVNSGAGIFSYDLNSKKRWSVTKKGHPKLHFPLVCSSNGKIAFAWETQDKRDELWLTDFSGSKATKLASQNVDFTDGNLSVIMFSPDGDELLFIPNAGNKSEIYTIRTDGTGLRKVTENIVKANGGISWSPDGKQIVFVSDQDGNDELYTVNIDGTELERLTNNNVKDCCPDW